MILQRKEGSTSYQDLYPNAVMRFEHSSNDAVNHVRTFLFRVYPSINHFNRPPVATFTLSFNANSNVSTIFTDGSEEFKFNATYDGYVLQDGTPYTPLSEPSVVTMGYPDYWDVGVFVDEKGSELAFKNSFASAWLLSQVFDGEQIGNSWEIIQP